MSLPETPDYLTYAYFGGAGFLGRLAYHAKLVQEGRRKPWSWVMLWDIPIALMLGWVSLGVGVWLEIPWEARMSIALVMAYLGPYGLDLLFIKWIDKWSKGNSRGKED